VRDFDHDFWEVSTETEKLTVDSGFESDRPPSVDSR